MQTLRKGSKGNDVVILQRALGVTPADGIFGIVTEQAVLRFQRTHSVNNLPLTADGVVGPKTWQALGIHDDTTATIGGDINIVRRALSKNLNPRKQNPIRYLVIHFTAGSHSRQGKARACYDVFMGGKASADFAVDDVEIVQLNPDLRKYYCNAVGGSNYHNRGGALYGQAVNANCISIEICSTCVPSTSQAVKTDNHKGWSFTPAALDNAVRLARYLMREYGISISRVIRHYDVTGKLCPGIYGWNDEPLKDINGKPTGEQNNSQQWQAFKKRLQ